jgi:Tfp pilus assembly protein PilO
VKKSEQVLALASSGIIAVAIGWAYALKPTIDRWREASDKVATLEDTLTKEVALVARRSAIEADRAAIEKALEDPAGGSPIPSFLDHVQSLSDAAGFKPMSLRYVRQDKYEAYSELRFELKARAPLSQLQDFLVKMTASVYYLRVHAITLNPRDDGTVEAEFSLVGLATKEPS